jgi:small conductance mechanosensitive channel
MDEQLRLLDHVTAAAADMAIRFGPKLLVAVLILVAGYFAGRWVARITARGLQRFQLEPPVRALVERAVLLLVLALFVIMALDNLGVELLPLIAGIGIAGAGVALAMQGVLSNVVAGLTIIFSRPFRVGDYISIAKEEGEVLDIRLFNTTLGHPDLSRVVIPNRKIVGEILHNYGRIRQIPIEVAVSHQTSLVAALAAINQVLKANPRVLQEPAPFVRVVRVEGPAIVIGVAPWVQVPDYGKAMGELYEAIIEVFRAREISGPVPQRDVRLLSSPAYLAGQGAQERLAGRDAA